MGDRIDIALDEAGDAALPRSHAEFVGMGLRAVGEGNAAVARTDIGEFLARAVHGFRRQETAERHRDAFEVDLLVFRLGDSIDLGLLLVDLGLKRLELSSADFGLRLGRRGRGDGAGPSA